MEKENRYEIKDSETMVTPSLLVYPDRILSNIQTMLRIADGPDFLRPHIKTHKTAEIINMQLAEGIQKFKCATIAEAELLALCKAPDILLAMQPVGANMERFFNLMETYPEAKFSALVDNPDILTILGEMAKCRSVRVSLWLDVNNGMNRTGTQPNNKAVALYRQMEANQDVEAEGFHVYDGHLRNTDVTERKKACDKAFDLVLELKTKIESEGITVKNIVAGGSPTFPFHAKRAGVEASPGTTLLWDAGYGGLFPEMNFLPAAVLLTRIISKPEKNVLCLDLGHKSIAPEMPFPRVKFFGMEDCTQKGQSEEHFILECKDSEKYRVGDVIYAVPIHICPTVAKYESLQVVSEGKVITSWKVAARNQSITI